LSGFHERRILTLVITGRDLALLPTFAAVVRRGSFTQAARDLKLTKSVVSDQVRALERSLGVRLLERTTRRLRLTQIGEQVLATATRVLEAAEALSGAVETHQERPTGTLRVTAPHDLATSVVAAAFGQLARQHPALRFELIASDTPRDLVDEGIDVAVRLGVIRQQAAVVRRLARVPEVIVAAGRIGERFGGATRPAHLKELPWIGHASLDFGGTWKFRSVTGASDAIAVAPRALASSTDALRQLVLAELGAAMLPLYAVREDLEAGRALRLCPAWHHRMITLYAVLPHRQPPARTRAFLTALTPLLPAHGFDTPGT
jgi:DNA-binding transcriptional LysR family regulator